jgi:hypothetical protein
MRNERAVMIMKALVAAKNLTSLCLTLGALVLPIAAYAADHKPNSVTSSNDLVPPAPPAPVSVFDYSDSCKDPFFPNSTRHRAIVVATAPVVSPISVSSFVIKALTGVPGQEIVMINNKNLAVGERGEVSLPMGGTAWITVQKVEHYSVWILPDGFRDPLIVTLPKDDQ